MVIHKPSTSRIVIFCCFVGIKEYDGSARTRGSTDKIVMRVYEFKQLEDFRVRSSLGRQIGLIGLQTLQNPLLSLIERFHTDEPDCSRKSWNFSEMIAADFAPFLSHNKMAAVLRLKPSGSININGITNQRTLEVSIIVLSSWSALKNLRLVLSQITSTCTTAGAASAFWDTDTSDRNRSLRPG